MKASIYSRDNFKKDYGRGTRGRTFTVEASKFAVEVERGVLTVTAQETEDYSPRNITLSTAPIREIQRDLTLQFTAEDVQAILDAALASGMIRISFTAVDPSV